MGGMGATLLYKTRCIRGLYQNMFVVSQFLWVGHLGTASLSPQLGVSQSSFRLGCVPFWSLGVLLQAHLIHQSLWV